MGLSGSTVRSARRLKGGGKEKMASDLTPSKVITVRRYWISWSLWAFMVEKVLERMETRRVRKRVLPGMEC